MVEDRSGPKKSKPSSAEDIIGGGPAIRIEAAALEQRRLPVVDKTEAERFVILLDPRATSFTFQTFDDDKERKRAFEETNKQRVREGKKERKDPFARVINGTLDECWPSLAELNQRGAGIFITVCETDGTGRKTTNIKRVRALFADLDGAPIEPVMQSERAPHIVVESSPRRYHPYWIVAGVGLQDFTPKQKAIAAQFNGDRNVHDLPRVMRMPGFVHRKGEPFLTRIIYAREDAAPYTNADFGDDEGDDGVLTQRINTAALANLRAWVPELFGGDARLESTGAYRISSASLGRDLDEDLSIHPEGIKDFGVHDMGDPREGRRTPLDVVMEYGGKNSQEATAWLRERLGMTELPIVRIRADNLAEATTCAEDALLSARVPIYQNGGALVRPVIEEVAASDERMTKVARFVRINEIYLRDLLNQVADFRKFNKTDRTWTPINPPH
jgi:RepB DNA-primase from phage plasmid